MFIHVFQKQVEKRKKNNKFFNKLLFYKKLLFFNKLFNKLFNKIKRV